MRIGTSDDCGLDRWDSLSKDERLLCPTDEKIKTLSQILKCYAKGDRGDTSGSVGLNVSWERKESVQYEAQGETTVVACQGSDDKGDLMFLADMTQTQLETETK